MEDKPNAPISSHEVLALHRAQRNHLLNHQQTMYNARSTQYLLIRPLIPHNAYRPYRQQHRKRLRDLVVQARASDLLDVDGVRLLQDVHLHVA